MRKPFNEEAERWLTHARDEFADADELRHRQRFYMALFHFQQAAEKALKPRPRGWPPPSSNWSAAS
jgi:hypothetical protein